MLTRPPMICTCLWERYWRSRGQRRPQGRLSLALCKLRYIPDINPREALSRRTSAAPWKRGLASWSAWVPRSRLEESQSSADEMEMMNHSTQSVYFPNEIEDRAILGDGMTGLDVTVQNRVTVLYTAARN